ncbi:type II secretion system F family protein [Candidatus Dojkabacteria bacterium]|uniref:Type II secretion system F family protein n=1 Tax=Candidatus Dojkabacteria bacterium TaxID=2099670 RepID=A0A847EU67_9BACT|nr:type II secretion system F family protein [Candidatus Dojkabacteria bacterium]
MPNFTYSARNNQGKEVKGKIEARDGQAVVEILQDKGLVVVNVKEQATFDIESLGQINIGGVPMKDKVVFMRQLATMVGAGLPLTRGLQVMEQQISNPMFKRVITQVKSSVEAGKSLAESFRNSDEVFDDVTINLIEAGESSGNLDDILNKLAIELEESKKLQGKLKGALTYPLILLVIIVGVMVLMMLVLVPAMSDIYGEFGGELPTITRVMVAMSDFFINYWWAIVIVLLGLLIGYKVWVDTPKGKRTKDKIIVKIPIMGVIISKMQLAQFTRLLGLLLGSGLSIIRALELTAMSLSNDMFKEVIFQAKEEVERGGSLALPIARSDYYPLIVSSMIAVGEETGELDTVLAKVSQYYKEEVDQATENMSSLLEPIFLVIMGVAVAFIALGVYTPMFQLSEVMGMVVDIKNLIV